MVDLAVEAFTTNNFDLAADIYERTIKESGPSLETYLGLADSCALSGQWKRAFEAYTLAYRLGNVQPERLKHLVEALVEMLSQRGITAKPQQNERVDMFSCILCKGILTDPVTIPCGHSFCRKCLLKDNTQSCKKCKVVHHFALYSTLKINVVLATLTERWFPNEIKATKLKSEGNKFFEKHKFKEAIGYYSEAFKYAPNDHLLASNRSCAYAAVSQYQEAFEDAELAVKLRPDWPKAYYRKATALSGLGRHDEATVAYLQCLSLDSSVVSAKTALAKSLCKTLSPLQPEDLKRAELRSAIGGPSHFGSNRSTRWSQPLLNLDTLHQLKTSLQQTVMHLQGNPTTQEQHQHQIDHFLCRGIEQTTEAKCQSAPNSPPSTPRLLSRPVRANSLACMDVQLELGRSRKRLSDDQGVREPLSPTRKAPNKQTCAGLGQAGCSEISDGNKMLVEDFECSLCLRLYHLPVTTPCGHVFCRHCLDRCLDHNPVCPLCKSSLTEYLAERRQATTEAIEVMIKKYFPEQHAERQKIHEEEMAELSCMGSDKQHEIPVFVCTLAYPTVPCPLHVFEPRYRLMIRQCMESGTRQFGMCLCLDDNEANFVDYGTMLEVSEVQYFPDGRSVVATVGGRRFKVLDRGTRDGYNTAKVEFLQDHEFNDLEFEELMQVHDKVHKEAIEWFGKLPQVPRARILQHFGDFPELEPDIRTLPNGPAWAWWLTAVLPLDPRAQLSILAMTSLRERLLAIQRVLNFIRGQKNK